MRRTASSPPRSTRVSGGRRRRWSSTARWPSRAPTTRPARRGWRKSRNSSGTWGTVWANATEPDAPKGTEGKKFHLPASWGAEFRRLGTQPVSWTPGMMNKPYGYQVLGGMLRYGNYDSFFINPIAEHVTQLHRDDPGRFMMNRPTSGDDNYGFNPSGKLGSGNDPLNSVLEGLGHSPEASEKFFTDSPTKYNEDGTVDKRGDPGFNSYLDEFTKEDFPWNIDYNDSGPGDQDKAQERLNDGPNALGHALESATTGRAYDDNSTDAIEHTQGRSDLTEKVVVKFGEHPELIRHNENGDLDEASGPLYALRDSLGNIAAEYTGDVQRAVSGDNDLPTHGVLAEFQSSHIKSFLGEVGQDPDAYGAITSAQQAYTTGVVNDVMNGESQSTVSLEERLRNAAEPGGTVAGIMSESRADAVLDYHTANDEAFNKSAEDKQKWVDRGLGAVIDNTAGRVPLAGDVLSWISEDIQSSVMDSVQQDSSDQAELEANDMYSNGREAAMNSAREAVARAQENSDVDRHPDTIADLQDSAASGAKAGHTDGAKWESAGDGS